LGFGSFWNKRNLWCQVVNIKRNFSQVGFLMLSWLSGVLGFYYLLNNFILGILLIVSTWVFYKRSFTKELSDFWKKRKIEGARENEIKSIMGNLGFLYEYDLKGSGEHYWFVEQKKSKFVLAIRMNKIKEKLRNKEITEENIEEIVDYERELINLKTRQKKFKLKEKVERDYYGKPKTKREVINIALKDEIFRKFGNKCGVCSKTEGLHIHHKDKNPTNNRISNLMVLCGVCHKKIHMNVR